MIYIDFTSPVNMNHYIWQWFNLLSVSKSSFAILIGIAPIPNWFNMSFLNWDTKSWYSVFDKKKVTDKLNTTFDKFAKYYDSSIW